MGHGFKIGEKVTVPDCRHDYVVVCDIHGDEITVMWGDNNRRKYPSGQVKRFETIRVS